MKADVEPSETKPNADFEPNHRSFLNVLRVNLNIKSLSRWLSDDNLTKKAYLNALAAALDYGARLLVGFIVTPFLVEGLGDYLYGAWRVLERLIGYISPASGRSTQALKWTLAQQQASTNYDEKRGYVGKSIAVWLLFLPILVVLGGTLAWYAPVWLDSPIELTWIVRIAAILLAINLILTSLVEVPQAVLEGENLGYKRIGLSATLVFVGGGLTFLALYLNSGIVGVTAATLGTTLLTGALFLQVVRRFVPWFGFTRPSATAVRQFLGLSWWFLVWNLIMRFMRASDVVMLGLLDSVESVTTYSLTKYAPETLVMVVAIVVFGIMPGLGGIIGSGDLKKAALLRNEIMTLTWLLLTVLGSTILMWNKDFISLWVGSEYEAGIISTLMIILMMGQFVIIRNDANIIDLTLNLKHKVLIGAIATGLSLLIAAGFVAYLELGIVGLCLGFIAGRFILSIGYPLMVGRFLGVSFISQLRSILRPAVVTGLLFFLVVNISEFFTANTWINLIISVSVTLVSFSLLAFYSGLSGDQRKNVLQRVRLIITTRSK